MRRCGGCGKQYRTGTMIFVSDGAGGLTRKRVGPCCAGRAVPVLVGSFEASRCKCGKPAVQCVICGVDGEKKGARLPLMEAETKIRNVAKAYKATHGGDDMEDPDQVVYAQGRVDGLIAAADLLAAGDFR